MYFAVQNTGRVDAPPLQYRMVHTQEKNAPIFGSGQNETKKSLPVTRKGIISFFAA
jgi:hypothetical protein